MKFKINRNLRLMLMYIIVVLIVITCVFLYRNEKYTGSKEERISIYSYSQNGGINYRVFLKPNILYNSESVGEDEVYITSFIDNITALFRYEFSGERTADISGDYDIIASVEGYIPEKDTTEKDVTAKDKAPKDRTIWKKQYVLVPKTSFTAKDKSVAIMKDVPINFQEYSNFAKKFYEASKVDSQVKITVIMNVNLKAITDKGLIQEKMFPAIVIPINVSNFKITKSQVQNKPGVIEEKRMVQLPVNKGIIISYSIILAILIIALLFLVLMSTGVTSDSVFVKSLNKIFKNYGSRLVALDSEIAVAYSSYNKVRTIDDLVRIADEVSKPIMYKYSPNFKDITQFYVCDSDKIYVVDLKSSLLIDEPQQSDNPNKTLKSYKMITLDKLRERIKTKLAKAGRHEPRNKNL